MNPQELEDIKAEIARTLKSSLMRTFVGTPVTADSSQNISLFIKNFMETYKMCGGVDLPNPTAVIDGNIVNISWSAYDLHGI